MFQRWMVGPGGSYAMVQLVSDPPGASVYQLQEPGNPYANEWYLGDTPLQLKFSLVGIATGGPIFLLLKKVGFPSQSYTLQPAPFYGSTGEAEARPMCVKIVLA